MQYKEEHLEGGGDFIRKYSVEKRISHNYSYVNIWGTKQNVLMVWAYSNWFYTSYSAFNNLNAQLYIGDANLGNGKWMIEMSRLHIFTFQTLFNRLCGADHCETVHKTQIRRLNANNSVNLKVATYLEYKINFTFTHTKSLWRTRPYFSQYLICQELSALSPCFQYSYHWISLLSKADLQTQCFLL